MHSGFLASILLPTPSDPTIALLVGIVAAFGSMACWVFTSIAFTIAGRRWGSTTINVTRSLIAAVVLLLMVRLLLGRWIPIDSGDQLLWLALSGIAGLAVGDQLMFSAFNLAGPRRTLLVLNLAPVVTALFAWPILGESLMPLSWIGMAITLAGIGWVTLERSQGTGPASSVEHASKIRLGIALAFFGTLAVSIGNALAKLGMLPAADMDPDQGLVDPLVAQNVRMLFGAAAIVLLAGFAASVGRNIGSTPDPDPEKRPARSTSWLLLLSGTLLGPLAGIWLFLVSVAFVKVAIAATIVALTPVAILPFNRFVEEAPLTRRAILGAIIAVLGVALLAFAEQGDSPVTPDVDDARPDSASLDFPP